MGAETPLGGTQEFFFKKTKTSLSSHNQVTTLCQKSKQSYEPFSRFWPKMANFSHFWPLLAKKSGFWTFFFESAHQICLKLGQKLGTVALNHLMAVLCLGKFSFWPFWPFLGQKYIACGDIIWFLAKKLPFEPISSKPRIRF